MFCKFSAFFYGLLVPSPESVNFNLLKIKSKSIAAGGNVIMKYMGVNLAYYIKEDWAEFLKMADDQENLHDTWEEWYEAFLKLKRELTLQGYLVNDCIIDLHELKKYCTDKGLKVNGEARSQFVQKG